MPARRDSRSSRRWRPSGHSSSSSARGLHRGTRRDFVLLRSLERMGSAALLPVRVRRRCASGHRAPERVRRRALHDARRRPDEDPQCANDRGFQDRRLRVSPAVSPLAARAAAARAGVPRPAHVVVRAQRRSVAARPGDCGALRGADRPAPGPCYFLRWFCAALPTASTLQKGNVQGRRHRGLGDRHGAFRAPALRERRAPVGIRHHQQTLPWAAPLLPARETRVARSSPGPQR